MKKLLAVMFALACTLAVVAQNPQESPKPPKFIWERHVTVPEGKAAPYANQIAQYRRAADTTKADVYWIGANSVTGDLGRVVYITFCSSFADIEKGRLAFEKIGAELRKDPNVPTESYERTPQSILAAYREDLSFQPEKVPAAQARYFDVTTITLKAGHMGDFAEQIKEKIELLKRGGLDHHFLVYQVISGLPSTGAVFYVVVPLKSLADLDADQSDKAGAVFTPTVVRRFEAMNREMISAVDSKFLLVRPDLSRPPQRFLAADPEFWTVKEPAALSTGKQTKKTEAAAKKESRKKNY